MRTQLVTPENDPALVIPFRDPGVGKDPRINQEVIYNPTLELALVFNGVAAQVDARSDIYIGPDFRYDSYYWFLPGTQVVESEDRLEFTLNMEGRSYLGLRTGDTVTRQCANGEISYGLRTAGLADETIPFDIVIVDEDPQKRFIMAAAGRLSFHKKYDFFTSYTENDPNTWRKGRRLAVE